MSERKKFKVINKRMFYKNNYLKFRKFPTQKELITEIKVYSGTYELKKN